MSMCQIQYRQEKLGFLNMKENHVVADVISATARGLLQRKVGGEIEECFPVLKHEEQFMSIFF